MRHDGGCLVIETRRRPACSASATIRRTLTCSGKGFVCRSYVKLTLQQPRAVVNSSLSMLRSMTKFVIEKQLVYNSVVPLRRCRPGFAQPLTRKTNLFPMCPARSRLNAKQKQSSHVGGEDGRGGNCSSHLAAHR